jgi:hypothetical protein
VGQAPEPRPTTACPFCGKPGDGSGEESHAERLMHCGGGVPPVGVGFGRGCNAHGRRIGSGMPAGQGTSRAVLAHPLAYRASDPMIG